VRWYDASHVLLDARVPLPAEKLLALIEPVQRVNRAVVRRELQLVEARGGLARRHLECRPSSGRLRALPGGGEGRREKGPVYPAVQDAQGSSGPAGRHGGVVWSQLPLRGGARWRRGEGGDRRRP
jgi:hypothetical protein